MIRLTGLTLMSMKMLSLQRLSQRFQTEIRAYGEIRRQPRRRPIADVRFQLARMDVVGVPAPIILVDRSGTYP